MSRDTRPRRRQELSDDSSAPDTSSLPGSDAGTDWAGAPWKVSASRRRNHETQCSFPFVEPVRRDPALDAESQDPERWDGFS